MNKLKTANSSAISVECYYWEIDYDGMTSTYIKTGVWQTKPNNVIRELSKQQYEELTK